jgi:CRP-like cAMP-binding protein
MDVFPGYTGFPGRGDWHPARGVDRPLSRPRRARPADIDIHANELTESRHAGGTKVFAMGDAPTRVFIAPDSTLELTRSLHGRRITVQVLGLGDVFGDPPIARMALPLDARALTDAVVLSIDSAPLWRILAERPRLALRWLVSIAPCTAATQARLVDLLGGLPAQLASVRVRKSERGTAPLSQQCSPSSSASVAPAATGSSRPSNAAAASPCTAARLKCSTRPASPPSPTASTLQSLRHDHRFRALRRRSGRPRSACSPPSPTPARSADLIVGTSVGAVNAPVKNSSS